MSLCCCVEIAGVGCILSNLAQAIMNSLALALLVIHGQGREREIGHHNPAASVCTKAHMRRVRRIYRSARCAAVLVPDVSREGRDIPNSLDGKCERCQEGITACIGSIFMYCYLPHITSPHHSISVSHFFL